MDNKNVIKYDFHVLKDSRIKFNIEDSLFSLVGDLIVSNFNQARILAKKINDIRVKEGKVDQQVTGSQINALGVLHEIFHFIIRKYEQDHNPNVFTKGIDYIKQHINEDEVEQILLEYTNLFPPMDVYKGRLTAQEYLNSKTGNKPNNEIILEEVIILHLENINPAVVQLQELFSDKELHSKTRYIELISHIESFFESEVPFGGERISLISFLKKPIVSSPFDIDKQLEYILKNWTGYVSDFITQRLLKSRDFIQEDAKMFAFKGGFVKSTPQVPDFSEDEYFNKLKAKLAAGKKLTEAEQKYYMSEVEQFTEDIDWMPKVVMLAKNAYVWLFQLSQKYQREIKRLDQIPDEELDQLARWNFTSLWLIGIWERSSASKKIKQIMGNPEATSSAYSLFDYVIANDLGGEDAFQNLKLRAAARNIKLASDMVPNHTGIYSKWVVEKPEYFIQSDYPPFPGYTFNSADLSDDPRVEVRIEDKYYSRSDAAVVFQRRDKHTGDVKYFYHGNDGTQMPWNDTSQLNLLNPEVRESLIQTIMHVARKTPIIRFDAAMTLTKKHYQRLWFPIPGTGGDIPSRADYAMTRDAFDAAMPNEFWREVVDRINAELPNTLLLAEAFWLMESYFVRTLGMHRVYNSAFMHMLMKEENDKYRFMIKSTLQFNPEILKRYVNFMSNPDEETAVNQFGKGDKYFGVLALMITLPGLPMFAHGQIEGYAEKYGMEYQRSYYNESVDYNLVKRHEEEIFPLLQKRYLFSQVNNFELYDFIDEHGNVNENVYAFSNIQNGEKAIMFYNNSFEQTRGRISFANEKNTGSGPQFNKLSKSFGVNEKPNHYYIYTDARSKMEYIIPGRELDENGMTVSLNGYQYKVFLNFREVYDETGLYDHLIYMLGGQGVPSIDFAIKELHLRPVHNALINVYNPEVFTELKEFIFNDSEEEIQLPDSVNHRLSEFLSTINKKHNLLFDESEVLKNINRELLELKDIIKTVNGKTEEVKKNNFLHFENDNIKHSLSLYFSLTLLRNLMDKNNNVYQLYENLLLDNIFVEIFERLGNPYETIKPDILLITILLNQDLQNIWKNGFIDNNKRVINNKAGKMLKLLFTNNELLKYVGLNQYQGYNYFKKEKLEYTLDWFNSLNVAEFYDNLFSDKKIKIQKDVIFKKLQKNNEFFDYIKKKSVDAGFRLEELLKSFEPKKEKKPVKTTLAKVTTTDVKKKATKKIAEGKKVTEKAKKVVKKELRTKKKGKTK